MRYYPRSTIHDPPLTCLIAGLCIFALGYSPAEATDYYVSTGGSNSNAGTSLAKPFLTIQQAANMARPGDNVYVEGGTYRETVTMPRSGSASAPISFQPYQGQHVTITGLDKVGGGWTQSSGSIYQATVSGGASQVFVNGHMMTLARSAGTADVGKPLYNNPLRATYLTVDSATINRSPTTSTVTSAALAGSNNLTGAKMAITSGARWCSFSPTITSQSGTNGTTLGFQCPPSAASSGGDPTSGNRYYLYGALGLLNAAKEYDYDDANSKLYLNAPGGGNPGQTVEVRKRTYGFNLGTQSYIQVSGFALKAASIYIDGNHNLIDNCQILYPSAFADPNGMNGPAGVQICGQNNTLRRSEIAYCWGDAVTLYNGSDSTTIDNNVIHDVGWGANEGAFVTLPSIGSNNNVTNNTMYNAGRSGVLIPYGSGATNTRVQHNDVSRYGYLTDDLGGIVTGVNTPIPGTVIAYNRVQDCRDPYNESNSNNGGIYLDGNASGATVHHNLVTGARFGLIQNPPGTNNNFYNNTCWDVGGVNGPAPGFTNCNTINNLANTNHYWMGSNVSNNVNTTDAANTFTNAAAGDFTLKSGSVARNAGIPIPGITDNVTDGTPDAGAFEYGVTPWTAGANWKTWRSANQTTAPLSAAVSVYQRNGSITTTGSLMVGNTSQTNRNYRSFVKFDLSGVASRPIDSAVLRIYENADPTSENGDVALYRVTSNDWTSTSITYGQSVDTGAGISGFYDPANLDLYTDIDVTAIVRDWLNGAAANYGFSLRGAEGVAGTAKYFEGYYGVTSPELLITYAVPEPSAVVLLITGLAGILTYAWQKRRSQCVVTIRDLKWEI